jgi:zinc D-Ala-D-Ala carboxypeptidase
MLNVSAHITYAEAIRSDIAKRYGINNYFTPAQLVNMKVLAEKVFEPLRKHFGVPIFISSFFRNVKLNELMGGVPDSQHLCNNGAAMDLDSDLYNTISNKQIFDYIKDRLDYDQLIYEGINSDGSPSWVHVSYVSKKANRHELLKMTIVNGKKVYESYT